MKKKNQKMRLNCVEREYLKALKPELRAAIRDGLVERAATFAKAIARLERKRLAGKPARRGATDEG